MSSSVVPGVRVPRVPAIFCPTPRSQEVVRSLPPLVVVRAPRGFGKTSTVAYWLRSGELDDRHAVWVTMSGPTSAATLWATVHDGCVAAGLAPSAAPPGRDAVAEVLGELRQRLALVIDGFHLVTDTAVDRELVTLTQTFELLHVVVISRVDRPISSIGPATVDTVTLGPRELTLGPAETALLAARLGLTLTAQEAEQLTEEYAGWPAFVRAALLETRRGPDGRLVTDLAPVFRYATLHLADEEHRAWRDIALALVIPDRLVPVDLPMLLEDPASVSAAEFALAGSPVLGRRPDGAPLAVGLRAAALDVLGAEQPEKYRLFNERIALWRRDQDDAAAALRHAVRAQAWPLVLELLEDNWAELLRHHGDEVYRAVHALPRAYVAGSPRLVVARDYVLNQDVAAAAAMALREGLLVPGSDLPFRRLTTTQRLALRFDGTPAYGADEVLLGRRNGGGGRSEEVRKAEPELLAEWALSMLYANDGVIAAYGFALACRQASRLGDAAAAREAASAVALATALLGHIRLAGTWTAHARSIAAAPSALERVADPLTRALICGLRLEPFTSAFEQIPPVKQGLAPLVELSRLGNAFAEVLHGRLDRARVEVNRHAATSGSHSEELVRASVTALAVDLALSERRLDRAGAILAQTADGGAWTLGARARHAFYVGGYTETLRLTEDAHTYAATRPRVGLELLLLHACAAWRMDLRDVAVDQLAMAVGIATDTEVLLPFLTVPRADLEALAPVGTYQRDFLDRPPLAGTDTHFPKPLQVGELSGAELRVLHELAEGIPVALIGRRLFIAESTVKTHLRRIYRKLGVTSRQEALERARDVFLLN